MSAPPGLWDEKYEILRKLGEGGMGTVYQVRHRLLDDLRVIKVIRQSPGADVDELVSRFQREARTATRLRHPGIAQLYDFAFTDDGNAIIVMEWIDGVTLLEILAKKGPFELGFAIEVALQALEALTYFHEEGFVHRDISPDNLMLTRGRDGRPLVKLIDLGLAKRLDASVRLTEDGAFLGKVRYSSPEQFSDQGVDARSDIYSFGVMFYELLTGFLPITGEQFSELLGGHLVRPPRAFAETDPQGRVPPGLREVVMRTLEKDRDRRISSTAELAGLLQPFRSSFSSPFPEEDGTEILPSNPAVLRTLPVEPHREKTLKEETGKTVLQGPESKTVLQDPGKGARDRRQWPSRKRVSLMLTAFLMAAAMVAVVVLRDERPESEAFKSAVRALREERWSEAARGFRKAIDTDPTERSEVVALDSGEEVAYLPHYFLGCALYRMNNYPAAWDAWRKSERQGAIRNTSENEMLLEYFREIEKKDLGEATERTKGLIARTEDIKRQIVSMLDDASLGEIWQAAPQLEQRCRAAVASVQEIRERARNAFASSSYTTIRQLEADVRFAHREFLDLSDDVFELLDLADEN